MTACTCCVVFDHRGAAAAADAADGSANRTIADQVQNVDVAIAIAVVPRWAIGNPAQPTGSRVGSRVT